MASTALAEMATGLLVPSQKQSVAEPLVTRLGAHQ